MDQASRFEQAATKAVALMEQYAEQDPRDPDSEWKKKWNLIVIKNEFIFIFSLRLLLESECSPYIQHVLCHILQPPCYSVENTIFPHHLETSHSLPPCRSVCKSAADTYIQEK